MERRLLILPDGCFCTNYCRDCRFLAIPSYDEMMYGGSIKRKCALDGEWINPNDMACNKFEP